MLPTDLENYLIACRNQKLPFDAVAPKLAAAGWGADMILSAKTWYVGNTPETPKDESTRIQNTKIFTTPVSTDHYPTQRAGPLIWMALFLVLSLVTYFILNTF